MVTITLEGIKYKIDLPLKVSSVRQISEEQLYIITDTEGDEYILKARYYRVETTRSNNSDNDEVIIWRFLQKHKLAPVLIDSFIIEAKRPIVIYLSERPGFTLDELYSNIEMVPVDIRTRASDIIKEMHRLGLVHCDAHLGNLVLAGTKVLLIDFEISFFLNNVPEDRIQWLIEELDLRNADESDLLPNQYIDALRLHDRGFTYNKSWFIEHGLSDLLY